MMITFIENSFMYVSWPGWERLILIPLSMNFHAVMMFFWMMSTIVFNSALDILWAVSDNVVGKVMLFEQDSAGQDTKSPQILLKAFFVLS